MALEIVDGFAILTEFVPDYLNFPTNSPEYIAATKWQAKQAAGAKARQPKPSGTSVGGVSLPGVQAPSSAIFRPEATVAKAKAKTAAEQKKANDKAKAAGAALPFPNATQQQETPDRTRPSGILGSDRQVASDTRPTRPAMTRPIATPTDPTPDPTPKPPTKVTSASANAGEAADKVKESKKVISNKTLDSAGLEKLGINRAVLKYMKENYPQDYERVRKLIDNGLQDKNLTQPERDRIAVEFKNTDYYRKATTEKNRTKIGAYFIENGMDTISNAATIDRLTSDVFLKRTNTIEQAFNEIRNLAAEKLGLLTSPDENKRKIGAAMVDGGQSFLKAANPYITLYATTLDIPAAEFDPFEDNSFLNSFRDAVSFADFETKIKADPRYIMSIKGRQAMDATKLGLQRLTRGLGLGYNPEQLETQAQNVVSGKQTFEQIEYSLRSIAGEAFPMFKDRILAGETVTSIASPYVSSMSRILEMPDASIDVSDPNSQVRKALIGDGKMPKPLWQFEQELFKDARWQYTSNARETMDRVSMDILQRFGVMG
jgi:hypothetical protein